MRMTSRLLLLGAALSLSVPAFAADHAKKLTKPEQVKFNVCMGMLQPEREGNADCVAVIKRANIPQADVEKMHDCESLQTPVLDNPDCRAMINKYPELVRGHGESMTPSEQPVGNK